MYIKVERIKKKKKEYTKIENFIEPENLQQEVGLKVLECIESQILIVVKYRKLSDITNLVQKTENGLQIIFSTHSLEKAVKEKKSTE